ncbi:hypothetical protein BH09ACT1_BH09ACT1_07830 [soil metagenome]
MDRLTTVDAVEFADRYWATSPVLSRAADLGQDFSDLFSTEAVDELTSHRALRTPFVRMANEGSVLTPSRYTAPGGFGAEIGDQLNPDKVLEEFAAGATLVLQGLHRTWEPLAEFTRQLVADLGHPCQVNAYITPASSRGFDPHYDVHDVFVIQIVGEKHWTIHEPAHPDPLRDQPWSDHKDAVAEAARHTPAIDETFRPGDVLYLPRGWIHSAVALGGVSIHLTIGVAALTRFDVVQALISRAADDAGLRSSLPMGVDLSDPLVVESLVRETTTALTANLVEPAADFVAERIGRTQRSAFRPEPIEPIATVMAMAGMTGSTPVILRQGLDVRVSLVGDSVRLVLPGKTVTLPAEAHDAVDDLLGGDETTAGSLAGLDPDSSLVVARRLVREGVLVIR